MGIKCAIIEDDQISLRCLENLIANNSNLILTNSFTNPLKAVDYLRENSIDLIFLDIEMPELNGWQVLDQLDDPPLIILTTGNANYALDAFEYNAVDFLTKPIEQTRFDVAVAKVEERLNAFKEDHDEVILIKSDSNYIKIKTNIISYLEAFGDYVKIYTDDEKYVVLSTLKAFEEKLQEKGFLRVHKSFLVNILRITKVEGNTIPMAEKQIPLSRKRKEQLLEMLKKSTS